VLATGDRVAVTEAFERYLDHTDQYVRTAGHSDQASPP
jgi:hypothetical protein